MSNALAIAAATAALRNLLLAGMPGRDPGLTDLEVTVQPPDQARRTTSKAQLNLFLYGISANAAWRNRDLPHEVRPGEPGWPPLALDLRYLLTAWGRGEADNDGVAHRVMGAALSLLHDHPLLGREALAHALGEEGPGEQPERLRITPLFLSFDELSKLWMAFQSGYRLSLAFEVTVLLLDSRRPARAPLPVLRRGPADRGPDAAAEPLPVLLEAVPPMLQPAVRLGEELTLRCRGAVAPGATVRFTHLRSGRTMEPQPQRLPDGGLSVRLPAPGPDAMAAWAPGFHSVTVRVPQLDGGRASSNALSVALAPRIGLPAGPVAAGAVRLSVSCAPRLLPEQRVLFLLGERQLEPTGVVTPADPAQPSAVEVTIPDLAAGRHLARLRVDGVDSIPVVAAGDPPLLDFDPSQTVTAT